MQILGISSLTEPTGGKLSLPQKKKKAQPDVAIKKKLLLVLII